MGAVVRNKADCIFLISYQKPNMDRKFYIAVLVIGFIALSSVSEGNPAARPRTRGDVSNAEQHPFLRAAKGGKDARCAGYCNTAADCGGGCFCNSLPGINSCY